MTKKEFKDVVLSAHAEYFPKASVPNTKEFIQAVIDELEGTFIDFEDDGLEDDPDDSDY
jgi:hypothetical protein